MFARPIQAVRPSLIMMLLTLLVASTLAVLAPPAFAVDELGSG